MTDTCDDSLVINPKKYLSPYLCDEEAMPFLADALGSWLWLLKETTENKRKLLTHALKVRAKVGTIESLFLAVEALGVDIKCVLSIKKYNGHHKKHLLILLIIRPQTDGLRYPHIDKYQKISLALSYTIPASVTSEVVFVHEISINCDINGGLMIDSTQYQPILPLSAQEFLLNKITQEDFSCIRFLTDDGPKDIEIINFRKEEGIVSFFALAEKQEFTIREIQVLTVDGEIFAKQMFDNPFTILNNKILISFSFSLAQSTSKIEFCEPPIYLFEYPNSIKDMLEKSRLLYKQLKAYTDVMQKARNQYK